MNHARPRADTMAPMRGKSAIGWQLDSFREARRELETSVLPLATSVDGRRFVFQASLHGLQLQAGGGPETRTEVPIRYARGQGIVVDGGTAPFHDALIRPAAGPDVRAWQQREAGLHAQLRLGELALAAEAPCCLTWFPPAADHGPADPGGQGLSGHEWRRCGWAGWAVAP